MPSSLGFPPVLACRYKPEPSSEVPAPRECFASANRCDQGSCVQHTDAGDRGQTTGSRVGSGPCGKLIIEGANPPVELAPLRPHVLNQHPHPRAERNLTALVQDRRKMLLQLAPPLWDDKAALQQAGRQLVDQRRSLAHQPVPGAVERLHVELLLTLDLDKAPGRPAGGLGERLRVAVVVLVRFHVRANILRRHQAHGVALGLENAAEMVSAAARLHRDNTRGQAGRELDDALPPQAPAHDDTPGTVQTPRTAAVLAQVNPKYRNLHGPLLPFRDPDSLTLPDERGGPFHK